MSKHKYSKKFLERTGLGLDDINPAKAAKETQEPSVAEQVIPKAYPHVALGMYPVKENSGTKYILIEIPYDPETGDIGEVKQILKDIREDVIDRFKLEVDNNGFFTGEKIK